MTYPSLACDTCKQRRVKCDESRPSCKRCQKANLVCNGVKQDPGLIVLVENEYATGRRRRPRGPNVKAALIPQQKPNSSVRDSLKEQPGSTAILSPHERPPTQSQGFTILLTPNIPLDDQALTYYSQGFVEVAQGVPDVMYSHMKYASADRYHSQPNSILGLSVSALSHAVFGRAQRSRAALEVGGTKYSKALLKINMALQNQIGATNDDVLLAVMLLSFYENSIVDKNSHASIPDLRGLQSEGFTHHGGAIAMLKLRQHRRLRSDHSLELDKLVRRSLILSLLLRTMPVPLWLQDGSQFGEQGFVLKLDRCVVRTAKLRHEAADLEPATTDLTMSDNYDQVERYWRLMAEAQDLDNALAAWAIDLPTDWQYKTYAIQSYESKEIQGLVFDGSVHVYPTVGHAGLWNRYRALRLAVNDAILQLSRFATLPAFDATTLESAAKLRIQRLSDDLCATIPYVLGLVEIYNVHGRDTVVLANAPTTLKAAVKATIASFLCWPLTIATTVSGISAGHQRYLQRRLLDVSEIVDDGWLERLATAFTADPPHPL